MDLNWIIMPISGGIIGYFTNWLAIKMIFRPLEEKRIFNIPIPMTPGLIPKERAKLTESVADTITRHVLTKEALEKNFQSESMKTSIRETIHLLRLQLEEKKETIGDILAPFIDVEALIGDTMTESILLEKWPIFQGYLVEQLENNQPLEDKLRAGVKQAAKNNLGSFMGIFISYDKLYDKIKDSILDYVGSPDNQVAIIEMVKNFLMTQLEGGSLHDILYKRSIQEWMAKLTIEQKEKMENILVEQSINAMSKGATYLAKNIDVKSMVIREINNLETEALEAIVLEVVDRELKMITWLGGVLGAIIGFFPLIWQYISGLF